MESWYDLLCLHSSSTGTQNSSPGHLAMESFNLNRHFMLKLRPADIYLLYLLFNYLDTQFSHSYEEII